MPFVLKDAHHCGIKSRGIARPERHNGEGILFVIRTKESKFRLVSRANGDLVITSFVIKTDKEQAASGVAKVVDGVVASGNRILKWEGGLVQLAVRDAHAPDEIRNVCDLLLVWFGGKNN